MFLIIILFTLLAIIATSLVLAANESAFYRTNKFMRTIVEVGKDTHRKIHKVIIAMIEMQHLLRPYDPATSVRFYTITHLLAREAQAIRDIVQKSGRAIDLAIHTSHILHLVVVTINLVLLLTSLVLLLLHWHPGFITIIFVCWILTTICWALTGFDFFLQTFVYDTCTAFQDFEQDPQNCSLSSMIPCMDSSSSDQLLIEIGSTIHNFVSKLNWKMEELYVLLPSEGNIMDLVGVKKICDPFSGPPNYTYIPESCSKDSISIQDIPNILSRLTCYQDNSPETCTREGKIIPESISNMALAYSRSVQNMLSIYPDLESLARCIVVKTAFSDVVKHQCKSFKASIRMLWSSMFSLSVFMMILVLIWVAKAYQERGRCFSRCSIVPDRP
ncbi:hypothetical protein P3X46_012601 [Hevea brasiliensis]|nr:hypothetical protein P3X46_012601 [Hevea brasiliensis]